MTLRRTTARALAVLTVFMFIAAACGGASEAPDQTATDPAQAAETDAPSVIPTTPPLAVETGAGDVETDEATESGDDAGAGLPDETEDPHLVQVLHVNDDVQIVPVFDAPNGQDITLQDFNEIDNIYLDYPLYAETPFGNRLALLVEEYDTSGNWARVLMPVRPNGTTHWVQTAFFTEEEHNFHITIDVTTNTVQVFEGETPLFVDDNGGPEPVLAVSGREKRPTPVVRAYIDEMIVGASLSPAYGDWVLSIAAFSEDLGTFGGGGGMPKLALHGTNQPELMGQYVSSGCVRIPNEIVSFIAETVPVGTIVDIVAS